MVWRNNWLDVGLSVRTELVDEDFSRSPRATSRDLYSGLDGSSDLSVSTHRLGMTKGQNWQQGTHLVPCQVVKHVRLEIVSSGSIPCVWPDPRMLHIRVALLVVNLSVQLDVSSWECVAQEKHGLPSGKKSNEMSLLSKFCII